MEKRNFYRLNFNLNLDYTKLDPETIETISNPKTGIIRDLSGGGLSFSTDETLELGELLELKINYDKKIILVLGKVVRKYATDNTYVYGLGFVYIDQQTQDSIVHLIFNIQRRERAMKKLGGGTNGHE